MLMLLVLLAKIASGLQIESNSANVENFNSGISGIASTTKSASDAEARSTEIEIRESAPSASSCDIRSFDTNFESDFEIIAIPLSTYSCFMSIIVTWYPAQAAT